MYRLKQLTLLLGDLVFLYLGLYLAMAIRHLNWPSQNLALLVSPMTILFLLAVAVFFIIGLYDLAVAKNNKRFFSKIALSLAVWVVVGVLYFYINTYENISPKTILLLTAVIGFGLVAVWRFGYNRFASTVIWQTKVVFIGNGPEIDELKKIIGNEPQRGYAVTPELDSANIIVVQTKTEQYQPELLTQLYQSLFRETGIVSLENFYQEIMGKIPPFTFSESWFIANLQEQNKKIYDRFKLVIDYALASIIGVFFAVSYPLIACAVKLNSPGPIFFKQKRVGKLGKEFTVYKYRTMRALSSDGSAEVDGPRFAINKDERITAVGKYLRKTRLDEIPQFINILKKEMSIVGPRPERPEFVKQLTQAMPYYALRHLVKPGVTGWAQIRHGYTDNMEDNLRKLEYDLYYIKNRGPLLDLAILLRTVNIIARLAGR